MCIRDRYRGVSDVDGVLDPLTTPFQTTHATWEKGDYAVVKAKDVLGQFRKRLKA